MTDVSDRPEPRRRARPAADDGLDPIDASTPPVPVPGNQPSVVSMSQPAATRAEIPAAAASLPDGLPIIGAPAPPTDSSRFFVTLNVRVAPDIDDLLTKAIAETGSSKRAVVEYALRHTYG